ncbi:DNA polymerase III subunit delta [Reinekea sp.]|jgi:DNA polymerase-3 subunit delta|uniref:DNA polymerase III subunit delta n=1 Tax=Reinekea sp. TaxID=1970455 RepID=UPI00398A1100
MKLTSAQLNAQLGKSALPTVIWISGDEPLLVIEASDQIRRAAKQAGVSERKIIDVDAKFDGAELIASNQSMSLFGDRELIELRLQNKFNDKGRKALLEYIETANPDNCLLIISDRIEAAQTKAKWFNKVVDAGWWLPIWPIEHNQLAGWLSQRFALHNLQADQDAIALMVERIDGNLLAAKQEIEKLALIAEDNRVTAETVLASVSDSSRYTVFDLASAMLVGDLTRSLKILSGLRGEGVEPPIVLWLLSRELRLLIELAEAGPQGLQGAFKRLRVFDKRQNDYKRALSRANLQHYQQCLLSCTDVDAMIKGQVKADPWHKLSELIVAISAPQVMAYSL